MTVLKIVIEDQINSKPMIHLCASVFICVRLIHPLVVGAIAPGVLA
ncbi:hypothetical protein [Fischerella thermalis]|nr:hypothetical protein [Fischerella thermalis]